MFKKFFNAGMFTLMGLYIASCSLPTDGDVGGDDDLLDTDVIISRTITADTTWTAAKSITISQSLQINNATLTLAPGVTIIFGAGAQIDINTGGGLIADGTTDSLITFTGSVQQAGHWDYIWFDDDAIDANCILKNCVIEYGGGYGSSYGMIYCDNASPTIENSVIRNSEFFGVKFVGDQATSFIGNTVTLNSAPISIDFPYIGSIDTGAYSGNTHDYIHIADGKLISSATLLRQDIPYELAGGLIENATLTIAPGTIIKIKESAELEIGAGGGLLADGTDSMITITGMLPQNGSWDYIWFDDDAIDANCKLVNCLIEYGGGYGDSYAMIYCDNASPSIENCIIRNSKAFGVKFNGDKATSFIGNTITLNELAPLSIDFTHLTSIDTGSYTGNTHDYIHVEDGIIIRNGTLVRQDVPYLLHRDVSINNATLTIAAGTIVQFDANTSLTVGTGGGLIANGTDSVITFTGKNAQNGWWDYLEFDDDVIDANCILTNCVIEYGGGYGDSYGIIYCDASKPTLTNCTIQHSEAWGIVNYDSAAPIITNATYLDNALGNVKNF